MSCLSRMRGNFQVRFLGEEVVKTTFLPDQAAVHHGNAVANVLPAEIAMMGLMPTSA